MKLVGKTLMVAFMVMSLAGMAWAGLPATDADDLIDAEVALSQQGNMLIYPAYAAGGGLETKIKMINTNLQESCRVKVVLRGQKYSQELLDFFVWLSPADVWTGKLYQNSSGQVMIESADGSTLNASSNFASETNPMLVDIGVGNPCDELTVGYVTAFVDWWTSDTVRANLDQEELDIDLDTDDGTSVVTKADIRKAIDNTASGDFGGAGFNSLTGNFEIGFPAPVGVSAMESALAFRNYDTNTELTMGTETIIGQNSDTTLAEVEALIAKKQCDMPYYNADGEYSAHLFTFPTKLTQIRESDCLIDSVLSPYFNENAEFEVNEDASTASETLYDSVCEPVALSYWDLEETPNQGDPGSPFSGQEEEAPGLEMCNEVEIFLTAGGATTGTFPAFQFDEGWARWNFITEGVNETCSTDTDVTNTTEVCYKGAPVIPHVLHLGPNGLSLMTGAYTDGDYRFSLAQ